MLRKTLPLVIAALSLSIVSGCDKKEEPKKDAAKTDDAKKDDAKKDDAKAEEGKTEEKKEGGW